MQMWKGMKMGKKKEKKKEKKRPRESVETPPPTPPPTSFLADFNAVRYKFPPGINIGFDDPLNLLEAKGITDRNNLLRTEESFKQSWDMDMKFSISYEDYYGMYIDTPPSEKEEGEQYFNSAAKKNYFDVPKKRPDSMFRGFFVIYPEGQVQKDPIFEREPYFNKYVPLISKLGHAAVEYHNFMTGSELQFSGIKKANLFFGDWSVQHYFITLEATDKSSSQKVTCQSRVACLVSYHEMSDIKEGPVPLKETYVESFHNGGRLIN